MSIGQVGERAVRLLCPNPSPMTLEGTNTWVLGEPCTEVVVVDPGPQEEGHLQAILAHLRERGATVALTLLTHGHDDHAGSASRWAELTGAPIRGAGHGEPLVHGEEITVDGLRVQVLLTPGHTADSVCFLLPDERLLLTGDTVLGRGTTVVAYPDGRLTAYLQSLEAMRDLARAGEVEALLPGHGAVRHDALAVLTSYLEHRQERLAQVAAAVQDLGPGEGDLADRVVESVYADVPRTVWPAARLSVLAQLEHLGQL